MRQNKCTKLGKTLELKNETNSAIHTQLHADSTQHISAEFGVSVHASARGRSYGCQLFNRALMHARNAKTVWPRHLPTNTPKPTTASKNMSKISGNSSGKCKKFAGVCKRGVTNLLNKPYFALFQAQ